VLSGKEVLLMTDRLYRLMTGSRSPERSFAAEDEKPVTRGDLMVELYDMLVEIGDI
jgi:hypothetical protein